MINRRNLFALTGAAFAVAGCTYNNGWRSRRGYRRYSENNPVIVARTLITENMNFEIDFDSFIRAADYCEKKGFTTTHWADGKQYDDPNVPLWAKIDRLSLDMNSTYTFTFSARHYSSYNERYLAVGGIARLLRTGSETTWETVDDLKPLSDHWTDV